MKRLIFMFLFSVPLLLITGCTGMQDKPLQKTGGITGGEVLRDSVTIKPGRTYEDCLEVQPGMVVEYEFDASDFVDFNVHYHSEDEIHYPVSTRGVMIGKGVVDPLTHDFYTPEQEFYCVMWENHGSEPVKLSFECAARNPSGK